MRLDDVLAVEGDAELPLERFNSHEGTDDLAVESLTDGGEVDEKGPQHSWIVKLEGRPEGQRVILYGVLCGLVII